jgi:hypothetical protein
MPCFKDPPRTWLEEQMKAVSDLNQKAGVWAEIKTWGFPLLIRSANNYILTFDVN